MNRHTHVLSHEITHLAEAASDLLAATADITEEKLVDARKRLAAGLEHGQAEYRRIRKSMSGVIDAPERICTDKRYQSLAIAAGAGVLIGYLLSNRCMHHSR
ncbi:MAG: hypothetical protein WCP60_07870 [bacterium]